MSVVGSESDSNKGWLRQLYLTRPEHHTSRGGLTTKIHALVNAMGLPIALKFSEDQAHDGRSAVDMFDTLQAGNILLADRAYDSNALLEWLAEPSSVSSISSNISAPSPHATTSETTTVPLPSSSRQCEYSSDLMSR